MTEEEVSKVEEGLALRALCMKSRTQTECGRGSGGSRVSKGQG